MSRMLLGRIAIVGMLATSLTIGLEGAAAGGGGWWSTISLGSPYLGVEETVRPRHATQVLFESIDAAKRARAGLDRYYVYLLRDVDREMLRRAMGKAEGDRWLARNWTQPSGPILAGEVVVRGGTANLANVHVTITIPDVEPGEYGLMVCSAACARPMADMIPSDVTVVADAVIARTARRLERLRWDMVEVERRATAVGRVASDDIADLEDDLERVEGQVVGLAAELTRLQRAGSETTPAGSWAGPAGWFVAGLAIATLLAARARHRVATTSRPRRRVPNHVEMELSIPNDDGPTSEPTERVGV